MKSIRVQVYDENRQVCCLSAAWISKSAALQRKGRVGRVAPGLVFRLYTENFYRDCMSEFNDPEISHTPLEKAVLEAKLVLSSFGSVSQLLSEAMSPPEPLQVSSAVGRLYNSGALSSNSEEANVTDYGRMCASLPLDMPLSKLIFMGCMFGCPADAIVMASALSLQDLFTTTFIQDRTDFVKRVSRSFSARFQFDGGLYSEPLACRSLYTAWLNSTKCSSARAGRNDETRMCRHWDTLGAAASGGALPGRLTKTPCTQSPSSAASGYRRPRLASRITQRRGHEAAAGSQPIKVAGTAPRPVARRL